MKGRHSITVDDTIWDLAQDKIDISLSLFIENTLKLYVGYDDELSKLMKKEVELQKELDIVQSKICRTRERIRKENNEKHVYDNAMTTINRIASKLGYIGENQIRRIANQNDIPPQQLIEHCKTNTNLKIEKFSESPKYPKFEYR